LSIVKLSCSSFILQASEDTKSIMDKADTKTDAFAGASDLGNTLTDPGQMTQEQRIDLALQNYVPDSEEEKRLVRKADMVLLPILWFMYILAYLDRGNIVRTLSPFRPSRGWMIN
jgi:hypothetical protein